MVYLIMRLMTDDYIMNITSVPIWNEWTPYGAAVDLKFLSLFHIDKLLGVYYE